jgi:Effector Associated Constant Component 1
MTIEIRIAGPQAAEDLASLHQWLSDEPAIRRNARIKLTYKNGPRGTLGPIEDAIQLALNDGFQIATLVLSYLGWRSSRQHAPEGQQVIIERDGMTVSLSAADPDLVQTVVRELNSRP